MYVARGSPNERGRALERSLWHNTRGKKETLQEKKLQKYPRARGCGRAGGRAGGGAGVEASSHTDGLNLNELLTNQRPASYDSLLTIGSLWGINTTNQLPYQHRFWKYLTKLIRSPHSRCYSRPGLRACEAAGNILSRTAWRRVALRSNEVLKAVSL